MVHVASGLKHGTCDRQIAWGMWLWDKPHGTNDIAQATYVMALVAWDIGHVTDRLHGACVPGTCDSVQVSFCLSHVACGLWHGT